MELEEFHFAQSRVSTFMFSSAERLPRRRLAAKEKLAARLEPIHKIPFPRFTRWVFM